MATEKEAKDEKTPVDELEPIDPLEEFQAQKRATQILDRAVVHIIMAKRPEIAAWQIAFALGSTACIGQSMSKVAADFGVSTAWMKDNVLFLIVGSLIGGTVVGLIMILIIEISVYKDKRIGSLQKQVNALTVQLEASENTIQHLLDEKLKNL